MGTEKEVSKQQILQLHKLQKTQNWKWTIQFAAQNHEDERKAGMQLPQPQQRPELHRRAPTTPGFIHPVY
jgi:hypothetical protein